MPDLHKSLAALRALGGKFESLLANSHPQIAGDTRTYPEGTSSLQELTGFGSKPGSLRMLAYVPEQMPTNPALVVALHGCGQTAAAYNHGSGWATLAERHGFVVIYPEQIDANNPKSCFSWFLPADIARDQGEALSVHQMTEHAITRFGIDRRRVYVTGLSAGGAMTSVMLATYPDVYAGGAIIAGLPYGCARNVQQAFGAMFSDQTHSIQALGESVRAASQHCGPWPKVSVWHGSSDQIVKPSNADHIVNQWADIHGIGSAPPRIETIGRHTRRVWDDANGSALIEAYSLGGMAHGVPIDVSPAGAGCGAAGPFFLDVGLSSTQLIARGWGLAGESAAAQTAESARTDEPRRQPETATLHHQEAAGNAPVAGAFEAAGRGKDREDQSKSPPAGTAHRFDPGAIIEAALKAAGLKR